MSNLLLRHHLLLNKSQSKYKYLTYISNGNGNYVKLDYTPNQKTKIIFEGEGAASGFREGFIFGGEISWGNLSFTLYLRDNEVYSSTWGKNVGQNIYNCPTVVGVRRKYMLYNAQILVDGELVATIVEPTYEWQGKYNLSLFTNNRRDVATQGLKYYKLYYFQIYEDNTLLYNLVPILDENNKACFLNTITGIKYYGNSDFIDYE